MPVSATDTPCVGVCSTIYGDTVCRGCKRFYDEIINWNTFDNSRKLIILERLDTQMIDIVGHYLEIADSTLLRSKCDKHHIKYRNNCNPLSWAYLLLREGALRIKDLSKYGIIVKATYQDLSLPKLYEHIDDALFAHAQQHFDLSE